MYTKHVLHDHETSKHMISEVNLFPKSEDVDELAPDGQPLRTSWRAIVGKYGIYVENMYDKNGELFKWTRFGRLKSGDNGSGPHMREDHSKLETCPLEKTASPTNNSTKGAHWKTLAVLRVR